MPLQVSLAGEGKLLTQFDAGSVVGVRGPRRTRLNPKDAYESDWLAGTRGSGPTILSGNGAQVIGLLARQNMERLSAVGLVFRGK